MGSGHHGMLQDYPGRRRTFWLCLYFLLRIVLQKDHVATTHRDTWHSWIHTLTSFIFSDFDSWDWVAIRTISSLDAFSFRHVSTVNFLYFIYTFGIHNICIHQVCTLYTKCILVFSTCLSTWWYISVFPCYIYSHVYTFCGCNTPFVYMILRSQF